MNPPFSAIANVDRRMADAALAAYLARPWRGSPMAAGWSRSPGRVLPGQSGVARCLCPIAGTRARCLFAPPSTARSSPNMAHHRFPSDRDRQGAGMRCRRISGLAWYCARRRHAAWLGHRHVPPTAADRDGRCRSPVARPAMPRWSAPMPCARPASRLRHRIPQRSNSPMRPSSGTGRGRPHHRRDLRRVRDFSRSVFPALSPIRPSWCNPPPWPRWHPRSLPIGRTFRLMSSPTACCPTHSLNPSFMPARLIPSSSRDHGPSTRPVTSSARRGKTRKMPCNSGVAGFSATAPVRARAARSRASCSTTG